ncbi:hypothetical protein BC827DRAFT_410163 [Russula dissimulans]|nr:hypothetical protein BC827DRAFT_410163 [Russula dissimulans]
MLPLSGLLALPEEILIKVLEDCEYRAILACKSICRRVYDIISRSISLRYTLELAANGMLHRSSSSLGKVQCLDMLAAYEAAWRTLSWSGNAPVEILIGWGEPVSVSGNVIAFPKPDVPLKELLLLRVPSKFRDVTMKSWNVQLAHDVRDICIDSAQNLLVCYCGVKLFHICSLLSGEIHPLVRHVGVINPTSSWKYRVGSMRVCGDHLAVASEQGLYISVWNWKSGEHISDFFASLQSSVFSFLDEYHILFPGSIDDGLYVYDIRAMPPINMRKPKLKGTHCFEITLPRYWSFQAVCNINLACNSVATGTDATSGLFFTNPDDRMVSLVITPWLNSSDMHAHGRHDHNEIHVRAHPLLKWTQTHPAPPNACVVIPWSAWGRAATRVVVPHTDDDKLLYMCPSQSRFRSCGMRIVSPPSVRSNGMSSVTVADCHPARVFRSRNQSHIYRSTEAGTELGQETVGATYERGHQGTQDSACSSRVRSKSLPLPTFFKTPSTYATSAMEVVKNIFLLRWYGPSQDLPTTRTTCGPRPTAKRLQYVEKEIPLPKELWLKGSKPVFNALCEDALLFYILVPGSNMIQYAYWYTF